MKKICIVVPYFGKLPNYFKIWLKSVESNPTIDFLLFLDDKSIYDYPSNVKIVYMQFDNLIEYIQEKFDFEISLKEPYKLCDFKPAYGYIFQDYLKDYDFWGFCDFDIICGNLRRFLNDEVLENDKILDLGHLSLQKNDPKLNLAFKQNDYYKIVFSQNYNFVFDEKQYVNYFDKIYINRSIIADINVRYNNLIVNSHKENGEYIFHWKKYDKNCELTGIYVQDGLIKKEEFLYIHLQKRRMVTDINELNDFFVIPPNLFINEDEYNIDKIYKKYNKKNTKYRKEYIKFYFIERPKRYIKKIKEKLKNEFRK